MRYIPRILFTVSSTCGRQVIATLVCLYIGSLPFYNRMGSYKHLNVEEKEYVRLPKNVLEDMFSTYHKMESYIETLEILSNKRLVSKLKESKRQKERGELLSWNEFRKVIE